MPGRSPLYIDTGAFIARVLQDDQYHRRATDGWRVLAHGDRRLLSSEHVLDECATLIARRAGGRTASEWLDLHLRSRVITWLKTGEKDLAAGAALMKKFCDQGVSFTDCLSFALMKRERCRDAFTYDAHFRLAGFDLWEGGPA